MVGVHFLLFPGSVVALGVVQIGDVLKQNDLSGSLVADSALVPALLTQKTRKSGPKHFSMVIFSFRKST